eukprot:CAMPEP_0195532282 /NCGR_PEP_ID=MMETSP0794_2-20130614/37728_1 /TAXON_ID=515487 /ORGANISM="Stephanopyxis turris, Strain CCMP 815" /LENGTH=589 /DNA_ID=CAMNT_0040664425 /DNA_START=137 /DNA_END=1906 /DNA_ORIENTATION=-
MYNGFRSAATFLTVIHSLPIQRQSASAFSIESRSASVGRLNSGLWICRQQRYKRTAPLSVSTYYDDAAETLDTIVELSAPAKPKHRKRTRRKRVKKLKRRPRPSPHSISFMREEMKQHALLTQEEEKELGLRISRGRLLRDQISDLLGEKIVQAQQEEALAFTFGDGIETDGLNGVRMMEFSQEELSKLSDLPYLSESRTRMSPSGDRKLRKKSQAKKLNTFSQQYAMDDAKPVMVNEASRLYGSQGDTDEDMLTEEDVTQHLNIPGGRAELRIILQEASDARQDLIRKNLKLVINVSKKWMQRNIPSARAVSSHSDTVYNLYQGGWDVPALDEVIQEGVLGLSRAVDKYDPKRGLKFSTYATHWITAHVRSCLRDYSTNCLRVPAALHDIKSAYSSIMRDHIENNGRNQKPSEMLTKDMIALEIGVSVGRLETALQVTQSLQSLDAPRFSGAMTSKGSGAGGDSSSRESLLFSDMLQCEEPTPEEFVELSFLRQCLENAMAAELSPHERDIIRLRLGLDDGVHRTVREVVDACGGSISMADVRTAERRAYKKLRSPTAVHSFKLLSFLDSFADIETSVYGWPAPGNIN